MLYKDILEYFTKELIGEGLKKLTGDKKPKNTEVNDKNDVKVNKPEDFGKILDFFLDALNKKLPSEKTDYDKKLLDIYTGQEPNNGEKVGLVFLPKEQKERDTKISKDMRQAGKESTGRLLMAGIHIASAIFGLKDGLDPKLLQSFENSSLSDKITPKDTQFLKDAINLLGDNKKSNEEKSQFLQGHIDNIAKYVGDIIKNSSDKDFTANFKQNSYKAQALEGLGFIKELAELFGIKLDDATKQRCEYLGKFGASAKEFLTANQQRISDLCYGLLENDSAMQFSNAYNTYYAQSFKDCDKAVMGVMKAFLKESVAEIGMNPETSFIDANGNVAQIDEFEKINPNLLPTTVFSDDGELKSLIDFDDISGSPKTYTDVKTFDLKDEAKTQEAFAEFSDQLKDNKFFNESENENLKTIKENMTALSGKDYSNINSVEATENTARACRDYIKSVRDNPNASKEEKAMATQLGGMYRSMCGSIGKNEFEKMLEAEKQQEKQNEQTTEKDKQPEPEQRKDLESLAQQRLNNQLNQLAQKYEREKQQREENARKEDQKRQEKLDKENEKREKQGKDPKTEDPAKRQKLEDNRRKTEEKELDKLIKEQKKLTEQYNKEKAERDKANKQYQEERDKRQKKFEEDKQKIADKYDKEKQQREEKARKEDQKRQEKLDKENAKRKEKGLIPTDEDPSERAKLEEKRRKTEEKEQQKREKEEKKLTEKYEKEQREQDEKHKAEEEKQRQDIEKKMQEEKDKQQEDDLKNREEDEKKRADEERERQEKEQKERDEKEKKEREEREKQEREDKKEEKEQQKQHETEMKQIKQKAKVRMFELQEQKKQSEINNKEMDDILNEIEGLDFVDMDETAKLQDNLERSVGDTNNTRETDPEKLSPSLEQQKQMGERNRDKDGRQSIDYNNDGSINNDDMSRNNSGIQV